MLIIEDNKASASKGYIICHYQYFLDNRLKVQPDLCNAFHDVLIMYINLNNIAISNIRRVDYCCIINRISESVAVN